MRWTILHSPGSHRAMCTRYGAGKWAGLAAPATSHAAIIAIHGFRARTVFAFWERAQQKKVIG